MSSVSKSEEIRWEVIKAMLDEFPGLRTRVKDYLKSQSSGKQTEL